MAKRLTDDERQQITAEYVECGNYRQVARNHGISGNTVKNIVNRNCELAQKFTQKKEQNTVDILAHMESRKGKVCDIIDLALDKLADESKYSRAGLQQIATMLGIVIDKFTVVKERTEEKSSVINDIADEIFKEPADAEAESIPSDATETD